MSKFDGRYFENFFVEDGLPGRHVNQLLEDKAGNIWAFTPKEGIGHFDGVRWRVVCQAVEMQGFMLDSLVCGWEVKTNTIWQLLPDTAVVFKIFTEQALRNAAGETGGPTGVFLHCKLPGGKEGIFKISPGGKISDFRELPENSWLPKCGDRQLEISKPGAGGVSHIRWAGDEAPFDSVRLKIKTSDAQLYHWFYAKNGDAYFALENVPMRKPAGKMEAQPLPLPVANPQEWLEDAEGALWLRSESGLHQFFPAGFSQLDVPSPWSMVEDEAGDFWIATFGHGLRRLDEHGQIELVALPELLFDLPELAGNFYFGCSKDHLGNLYFPHSEGLIIRRKNGQFENLGRRAEVEQRLGTVLFSLFDPEKKQVLAGMRAAVIFYQPQTAQLRYFPLPAFGSSNVVGMAADGRGNYWFASSRNGIARWDIATGEVEYFQKEKNSLPFDGAWCIENEPGKGLWFGAPDGLYFYSHTSKAFQKIAADRLPNFVLNLKIVDSLLMIGEQTGLYALNLNAFHATGADRLKAFNQLNGFGGVEPNQNGALLDSKGNYWVLCTDQILCVHKSQISLDDNPAKVRIWKINRERVPFSGGGVVHLPKSENEIIIRFEGIGFQRPLRTQYSWRLPGFRNKWSEWSEDEIAFLSTLPSGKYQFEVRSRHPGSVDSTDYRTDRFAFLVSLPFYRQPHFFKNAFLGGLALAGLVLVVLLFYLKARREARQEHLRAEEQNRQAHLARLEAREQELQMKYYQIQTLLAQLNPHFLFNLLETIKDFVRKNQSSLAAEHIDRLSKLMRHFLESSIRSDLQKIREGAHGISLAAEIELLTYYIELEQVQKPGMFRYIVEQDEALQLANIFITPMIIQPFVENAIKRGIEPRQDKAGMIWLKFLPTIEGVRCVVEDNGIGREASRRLQAQSEWKYEPRGTALVGDRVRLLRDFGVDIQIETCDRAGGGTVVTIDFN